MLMSIRMETPRSAINVNLPLELKNRVAVEAIEQNRSRSGFIETLIMEYFEDQGRPHQLPKASKAVSRKSNKKQREALAA
jgi:hypothetical protein